MSPYKIHRATHATWLSHTYVIENTETNTSLVIDVGMGPTHFATVLNRTTCVGILCTHADIDHIATLDEWCTYAPLYGTKECLRSHKGVHLIGGEDIAFEGFQCRTFSTPGHLQEHLSFFITPDLLFSGDLLFRESVGGTKRGSFTALMHSIDALIKELPLSSKLLAGHGEESTLQHELECNPIVCTWRGTIPPLHFPCTIQGSNIQGKPGEVLQRCRDYDGEEKFWVRTEKRDYILSQDEVILGK